MSPEGGGALREGRVRGLGKYDRRLFRACAGVHGVWGVALRGGRGAMKSSEMFGISDLFGDEWRGSRSGMMGVDGTGRSGNYGS